MISRTCKILGWRYFAPGFTLYQHCPSSPSSLCRSFHWSYFLLILFSTIQNHSLHDWNYFIFEGELVQRIHQAENGQRIYGPTSELNTWWRKDGPQTMSGKWKPTRTATRYIESSPAPSPSHPSLKVEAEPRHFHHQAQLAY